MLYILLIASTVIIFDQVTKILAKAYLSQEIVIIPGFFNLTFCENKGIAWGIAANKWVLLVITILALGLFIYMAIKAGKFKDHKWYSITIAFFIGGTIGNFIDRMFRVDGVIDFLNFYLYYPSFTNGFKFKAYDFPIFNIADSFLVVGAIMLIIYVLFIEGKEVKNKE